jgi:hypothetical protein
VASHAIGGAGEIFAARDGSFVRKIRGEAACSSPGWSTVNSAYAPNSTATSTTTPTIAPSRRRIFMTFPSH